jgi:L-threonylcarbamoyladenylate synthase
VPDEENLRNFLEISGPLVAPSANPQDKKPARNIDEARKYFGEGVDFYIDGGDLEGSPSTLVCFRGKKVELLRQGRRRVK